MKIIIEIEGIYFKDVEKEGKKNFKLETDCYYSLNEIIKCILESGYTVKAYKLFDGRD